MRSFVLVAVLVAVGGVAHADVPCTAKSIRSLRMKAQTTLNAGDAKAAIELLQSAECWIGWDQDAALQQQLAWRLSDLAHAHYIAGDYKSCYAIAARETTPYAGNVASVIDDGPVLNALDHNAAICHEAATKDRGTFVEPVTCTLDTDEQPAFGIPGGVLASDRAACLVIEPGELDDGIHTCGDVVLVRQTKRGSITRTRLVLEAGNLADGEVCCNVETVQFGAHAGGFSVFATSGGRNCDGGTASSSEEHVYALAGTKLQLVDSVSVYYH